MRILFVADGRSPTALHWLRYWIETGHTVDLVSSFRCEPPSGLASFRILPVAFAGLAGGQAGSPAGAVVRTGVVGRLRNRLRNLRYLLGPLSLPYYRKKFSLIVTETRPDLVHALRIPFEGMLAAALPRELPLAVSIWGNDLTLHAPGSAWMARETRRTLRRADGLLADTQRDIQLARRWEYADDKPGLVVPGGGGIDLALAETHVALPEELPSGPILVNPRGQRPGSLRQDLFFQAIPVVLEKYPQATFVCPGLAGEAEAEGLVHSLGIRKNTRLWPRLSPAQVWKLYEKSAIYVSPSVHDGTPNSLLESMACGCFPVVGDIESMREWIRSGVNGLLVDANSAASLAEGMLAALADSQLRSSAQKENASLIAARADYRRCMQMAEAFLGRIVEGKSASGRPER